MIASIVTIGTLELPELEPYRTLKRERSHCDDGIFVAEGSKVVRRLLASPITIISVLVTPSWLDELADELESRPEALVVYVGEKKLLQAVTGFNLHQCVMAVARTPQPSTIEAVMMQANRPVLAVALDGLTSSDNTGLVVRNCAACGADVLIVGETSADPYLRRAVRKSMGTIFYLPVVYAQSLDTTLEELRTRYGFRVYAAHPRPDSRTISETDFAQSCCVVLGSEGEGLSDLVLRQCDGAVQIPMRSSVDSFNVACASAIILYEADRQRRVLALS